MIKYVIPNALCYEIIQGYLFVCKVSFSIFIKEEFRALCSLPVETQDLHECVFKWCTLSEKGYTHSKNDFLILIKHNKIKKKSLKGA